MNTSYYYENAQICKNGHIRNICSQSHPEQNEIRCSLCGEEVISCCPSCKSPIRGGLFKQTPTYRYSNHYDPFAEHHTAHKIYTGTRTEQMKHDVLLPAFCNQCGSPYPWTETRLEAFQQIVDSLDDISPELKERLKNSFPDIVCETPKTELAAIVVDSVLKQSKGFAAAALKEWIKNYAVTLMTLLLQCTKNA